MSVARFERGSLDPYSSGEPDLSLELSRNELEPIESALEAIGSFFRPPSEESYWDPQSGLQYQTPSSNALLKAMIALRSEGDYQGVGVNKNQRFPYGTQSSAPCDVFYFVKKSDQLQYERGEWGWIRSGLWGEGIQDRQIRQQEILEKIEGVLRQHGTELGYETFISHTLKNPTSSFFSPEDALKMDAFILYHKRIQEAASSALVVLYPKIMYQASIGPEQVLTLVRNGEGLDFLLHNKGTGKTEKISEIDAPFPYKLIPDWHLIACLRQAAFRIVPLSDGTLKLSIQFRLLGGMMSPANRDRCANLGIGDPNVSDETVVDNMLRAIAKDAYSSISVQTLEGYQFPGTNVGKRVREIRVTIGNWDWFVHLMRALVAEPIRGINENRAVAAILGSQDQRDIEAMKKAYQKNCFFKVYVAYDYNNFYLEEMEQSAATARAEAFQQTVVAPVRGWCVVS